VAKKSFGARTLPLLVPAVLALVALALLLFWWRRASEPLALRVPGTDRNPQAEAASNANPILSGVVIASNGLPSDLPGAWPQFRGPGRDGLGPDSGSLLRSWEAPNPRPLWSIDVGEGYAGAAVLNGRVYLMDYDAEKRQDALRCLSLADGRELWRFAYPLSVKRNHGMSRTVPAATDKFVVAMGPRCHVVCVDALTGQLRWGLDLARQYGATVPPWYAGQCPLIDGDKVILAPGGKEALLLAVDAASGKVLWQTPNPQGWKMTHSSVMPMEFGGERMYVYCASEGVVGVSARDGSILWQTTDWKISIATVPSPVVLDGGRLFLSGGYDAGSLMLQIGKDGDRFTAKTLFKLSPDVFGATQQSPILFNSHLYGVRPDGRFVCLDLDGKTLWTSAAGQNFGLGPFLISDGLIFAMDDSGLLRLIEATPERYHLLSQSKVLTGRESWGPLALAGNRLLARDLTRLVCLEVGK
jgi:outer membrane protein assembly factor BamB